MAPQPQTQEKVASSAAVVLLTGSLYIASSAGLIAFNKVLMKPDMFPYPAALGLLHTVFCSAMAFILYSVNPSLFPSLTSSDKKVDINMSLMRSTILPIAGLFSLQIILSNQALAYCDIAFLQMLKESNVVLVYLACVLLGTEIFKWRQMHFIGLITIATFVTIRGEIHFVLIGFLLQASCCFVEATKIALQGLLLSSRGRGLDALSYMLVVMPTCVCVFGPIVVILSIVPNNIMPMPSLSQWFTMRWYLLGNACAALFLNLSIMLFIQHSSAMSFVFAGITKDVAIVLLGVVYMGHTVTGIQTAGFAAQVGLILVWSLMKTFPKQFEPGVMQGFTALYNMNKDLTATATAKEKTPLLKNGLAASEDAPAAEEA